MLLRSYKYQQPMSTACYNKTNFTNYVKNTGFWYKNTGFWSFGKKILVSNNFAVYLMFYVYINVKTKFLKVPLPAHSSLICLPKR